MAKFRFYRSFYFVKNYFLLRKDGNKNTEGSALILPKVSKSSLIFIFKYVRFVFVSNQNFWTVRFVFSQTCFSLEIA